MNTSWSQILPGTLVTLALREQADAQLTVCVHDQLPDVDGVAGRVISLTKQAQALGLAQATAFAARPFALVSCA